MNKPLLYEQGRRRPPKHKKKYFANGKIQPWSKESKPSNPGIVGFLPVFETREHAICFSPGAPIIELEI